MALKEASKQRVLAVQVQALEAHTEYKHSLKKGQILRDGNELRDQVHQITRSDERTRQRCGEFRTMRVEISDSRKSALFSLTTNPPVGQETGQHRLIASRAN